MSEKMIELGDKVRDRISGLEGIVIGLTKWLYGCVRVSIQPQESKDGRPADSFTIDEPQCELVKSGAIERPQEQPASRHGNRSDIGAPRATPTR